MNKPNMAKLFKNVKELAVKHTPEILTGIGIAGMLTTTYLAVRATPTALTIIEEAKKKEGVDELTPLQTVKVAWKPYIPAAVTAIASTACLVGASSVHLRRNAALATAYKISETALTEYKEKAIEVVGEKKEQAIREKVAEDRIKTNPVGKNEVFITGKGETLFLDPMSKRYFKSDIDHVRKVENILNKQMLHDITGYVSLSDFYDELGLAHTAMSDDLGWNVNNLIDMDFYPVLTDEEQPCICLDYQVAPKYDYTRII
jgi:hypothetical protein